MGEECSGTDGTQRLKCCFGAIPWTYEYSYTMRTVTYPKLHEPRDSMPSLRVLRTWSSRLMVVCGSPVYVNVINCYDSFGKIFTSRTQSFYIATFDTTLKVVQF